MIQNTIIHRALHRRQQTHQGTLSNKQRRNHDFHTKGFMIISSPWKRLQSHSTASSLAGGEGASLPTTSPHSLAEVFESPPRGRPEGQYETAGTVLLLRLWTTGVCQWDKKLIRVEKGEGDRKSFGDGGLLGRSWYVVHVAGEAEVPRGISPVKERSKDNTSE